MQAQRSLRFLIGREQRSVHLLRRRTSPSRSTGRSSFLVGVWRSFRRRHQPRGSRRKSEKPLTQPSISAVVEPKLGSFRIHFWGQSAPRASSSPPPNPALQRQPISRVPYTIPIRQHLVLHRRRLSSLANDASPRLACIRMRWIHATEARCSLQGDVATSEGGTGGRLRCAQPRPHTFQRAEFRESWRSFRCKHEYQP